MIDRKKFDEEGNELHVDRLTGMLPYIVVYRVYEDVPLATLGPFSRESPIIYNSRFSQLRGQ